MMRTYARTSPEIDELERHNASLARQIAGEGIVLLENHGVLPVQPGRIALFGEGAGKTVKGGTGSGEVNARYNVNIRTGLENAGYKITTAAWLDEYDLHYAEGLKEYEQKMKRRTGWFNMLAVPYLVSHPFVNPAGRPITAQDLTDRSETCFYVISRQTGEEVDRKLEKGDYYLTDQEVANIKMCAGHYLNIVLIINSGGLIDLQALENVHLGATVFFCQQGCEGGNALADIISGQVSPSGHLASTWPERYEDVPFGNQFSYLNGNLLDEDYREDIYVGYRYFDSFKIEPRYPFGYGRSYTTFDQKSSVSIEGENISVTTLVTNTGTQSGKAVTQVYVSCPRGRLAKEYQRLVAFNKSAVLEPRQTQVLETTFTLHNLTSYDPDRSQTILETGYYIVRVGEHSRSTQPVAALRLDTEVVVSRHQPICPLKYPLELLTESLTAERLEAVPTITIKISDMPTKSYAYQDYPVWRSPEIDQLMARLSDAEKGILCVGAGLDIAIPQKHWFVLPGAGGYTTSRFESRGIPAITLCDGPAGLRLFAVSAKVGEKVRMVTPAMAFMRLLPLVARKLIFGNPKNHQLLYQYATAFPVGMSLAQTWNQALVQSAGKAVQTEMAKFGAVYWLAPGMNIHRNPLCGRNYEYFSEDPLLSGKMAAAMTRGVQSTPGYHVTLKHFCANNQEVNRHQVSANVSERALREIYLRGFEIAVRESAPRAIMTSYNRVNGIFTAESHDLCTKVLHNEWNFDGLVMTDWTTGKADLKADRSICAGVDLIMPGQAFHRRQIEKARRKGCLAQTDIDRAATHVLRGVLGSAIYELFRSKSRTS